MKNRNKEIVNNINYSENKIAKKILRDAKISNWMFYLMFILETITYVLMSVSALTTKGIFLVSIIYLILSLYLVSRQKQYLNKIMSESMNKTICPEAFFNLNLYNAKKIICTERLYNYSLNNIAYAYIQTGDFDKASEIIKYLDTRKKDLILQSEIIQNKINIAFLKNDIKKLYEESENLKKVISFIPKRYKKEILLNVNLKQAVTEKNIEEVNNKCDLLEKKKNLFNKLYASYYRGLVLVKSKKQGYEEYYKFVAENGNNLVIANKAREKLKVNNVKNNYKRKLHIVYKIFNLILLTILFASTFFWGMYTIYIFVNIGL